jgi:hypothetical protein
VEEGEIDRMATEAGEQEETDRVAIEDVEEEEMAEGTEGIDGAGAAEEVEAAMPSGADPDSVDSLSKESIAGMAITVPIPTTLRTAITSPTGDWQIHRNRKERRRITIHGNGSSRGPQRQMIP